jgi:hypothetical protein
VGQAKPGQSSVATAPEPVFLKTDHCARNKNVKFSKIFMYMALILTLFWEKRIFEFFFSERYSYLHVTVTVPVTVTLLNRVYSVAFISYCFKFSLKIPACIL